jgi:hypothetical protein
MAEADARAQKKERLSSPCTRLVRTVGKFATQEDRGNGRKAGARLPAPQFWQVMFPALVAGEAFDAEAAP